MRLRNNVQHLTGASGSIRSLPIGDPTRECEDASTKAIQLTRAIQDQTSSISIVEWFDDLDDLASSVYDVGLNKQAAQIRQFEYYILTTLAAHFGRRSEIESRLARCLYNLAVFYFDRREYDKALPLLERAEKIYQRLGEPFRLLLADCLCMRLWCLPQLGKLTDTQETIQEGLDLLRELALNNSSGYGHHFASALLHQTFLFLQLREYQKVLDCSEEAISWLSKSSSQYKDEFPYQFAYARWNSAVAYKEFGDFEKANEHGREAVKTINKLISDRPLFYAKHSRSTAFSHWFLKKGRQQDALHVLEESLTVYCSVEALPTTKQHFADVLYQKAEVLHSEGDFDDALKALSQVIDILRRLLEEDEKDPKCFIALLSAFKLHSSCLVSLGRQSEAIETINASLDALRSSLVKIDLNESRVDFISDMLTSQESMLQSMDNIDAVKKLREYKKALTCIGEGIREKRRRVTDGEHEHSNLAHLLDLQHKIFNQLSRFDEALLHIQESVDLRYLLARRNGDEKIRIDLIRMLYCQARCLNSMERTDDALESLDKVLKHIQSLWNNEQGSDSLNMLINILSFSDCLIRNLVKENEYSKVLQLAVTSIEALRSLDSARDSRVRVLLGSALENSSVSCFGLEKFEEAIRYADEAVQIYRGLVEEDVDKHEWDLAWSLYQHARSLLALDNPGGAINSIEESVNIYLRIELRDPDGIRDKLADSLTLRAEVSYRLGRAGGIQDA